ncbi:MAG: hypothetical protein WCI41_03935 [bacterium]
MKEFKLTGTKLIPTDEFLIKTKFEILEIMYAVTRNIELPPIVVLKSENVEVLFSSEIVEILNTYSSSERIKIFLDVVKKKTPKDSYFICDGHNRAFAHEVCLKEVNAIEIENVNDVISYVEKCLLDKETEGVISRIPQAFFYMYHAKEETFLPIINIFSIGMVKRVSAKIKDENYDLNKLPINLREMTLELKERCKDSYSYDFFSNQEDLVLKYLREYH